MIGSRSPQISIDGTSAVRYRRSRALTRWPLRDRDPHLLETVRPGVFAAGDVRQGAAKRVAGAGGDGELAVPLAHQGLDGA